MKRHKSSVFLQFKESVLFQLLLHELPDLKVKFTDAGLNIKLNNPMRHFPRNCQFSLTLSLTFNRVFKVSFSSSNTITHSNWKLSLYVEQEASRYTDAWIFMHTQWKGFYIQSSFNLLWKTNTFPKYIIICRVTDFTKYQ